MTAKGKIDHEGDTDMAEESKYDVNPEIWAVDNRFFEQQDDQSPIDEAHAISGLDIVDIDDEDCDPL